MSDLRAGGQGGRGKIEADTYPRPPGWTPRTLESTVEGVQSIPTVVELKPGQTASHNEVTVLNMEGHLVAVDLNTPQVLVAEATQAGEILIAGPGNTDAQVIYQAAEQS